MNTHPVPVGSLLREWRQRRRLSQMDLALQTEISTRHLSFVETGRSRPSRDMVTRLAQQLDVPLRERNALLMAAGFAPAWPERPIDDPDMDGVRRTVDLILTGHEPVPALAIDRRWNLVAANRTVHALLADVDPALLAPPVNVIRLSLHPDGLAPRILNLAAWRDHLLTRLSRDKERSGSCDLLDLMDEIRTLPIPHRTSVRHALPPVHRDVAMPLLLRAGDRTLRFHSTTTVFGTPIDITLSELAIEAFFPADAETAEALAAMLAG